ncbi:hypothetical protein Tco_1498521 [Tanacetum coccineum]
MPPRRNHVNNVADPTFTAAVAQAVADLLPTLTPRITDEIRQNENNGNNVNRRNARRVNHSHRKRQPTRDLRFGSLVPKRGTIAFRIARDRDLVRQFSRSEITLFKLKTHDT